VDYFDNIINPLAEKIEKLSRTSLEICKYKIELKTSNVFANLIFLFILSFCILLMTISLNIAAANWLGGLFKNIVMGYLTVSIFYFLITLLIFVLRRPILITIQNKLLTQFQTK
jgi:hypothetical protein